MKVLSVLALTALVAGCATVNPVSKALAGSGGVTLSVAARVQAGRTVQSLVTPYTPSDVDHLEFTLSVPNASGGWTALTTQSTPAGSGTADTVNFEHLKMDTTYQVKVDALLADGTDITANGSGTATIATTNDNYVPLSVAVTLENVVFDGTMHPVVTVASGSVVNTTASETGVVVANN